MGFFKQDKTPAQNVVQNVLKTKKDERVLIIANPETNVIAQELFSAFLEENANPVLVYQTRKTSLDFADRSVVAAIKTEPDIILSISDCKLGRDKEALESPYTDSEGKSYTNAFDYLLSGKKCTRAVWTPGITEDMFERTVNIDYKLLKERCDYICKKFENAISIHVTADGGTDVTVSIEGRAGMSDDGDFSQPGNGGNIPAGEAFISPVVGKTQGIIVFDASMTFATGDAILSEPISIEVKDGYITEIKGGSDAKRLLKDISDAEKKAEELVSEGKFSQEMGETYKKNARNIGELGIGLNPSATISGNMLEDEKAFRTCHFAIGENYDGDAPALIHFDGLVRNPTIDIIYNEDEHFRLMENGELILTN